MTTNTQQVQLMNKMTGVPEDFLSHHASWRAALEHCIKTAPEATHDMDDKAYWRHELIAFDRAYAELNAKRSNVEELTDAQVHESAGLALQAQVDILQSKLREVAEGFSVIEKCLAVAQKGAHSDAPFPLDSTVTKLQFSSSASAYQQALEMCNSRSLTAFIENGFIDPKIEAEVARSSRPPRMRM